MTTAEEVAMLGQRMMPVSDQLSKLRPMVRTGLGEKSVELKPVPAQRKRSQQARYQALVEAHFKEQKSCSGLKPCEAGMSDAAAARMTAAMEDQEPCKEYSTLRGL